ncbi:MAG: hypothetical protein GY824_04550, partial [Delftia sp.]|nr:hypothetical protein [Delftia sp.]
TAEIRAAPGDAVRQAQELYARWAEADDEAWEKRAAQAAKRVPPSLMHQYWAWQLQQTKRWDRGGGYLLADLRGHGLQRLDRPHGSRILRTKRVRATRVIDALARKDRVEPTWPRPAEAIDWLVQVGVAPLERTGETWQSGPVRIAWKERRGVPWASLAVGVQNFALVVERKGITLHPMRQGKPVRNEKEAATAMEPPLRDWLRGDEGREALAMWAVWAGKLLKVGGAGLGAVR